MAQYCSVTMLTLGFFLFVVWTTQPIYGKPARDEYDDTVEVGFSSVDNNNEHLNPHEVCKLPMKRGYCRALLLRWRYDSETKECTEFKYGGCEGNANNFMTWKECMKMCSGV